MYLHTQTHTMMHHDAMCVYCKNRKVGYGTQFRTSGSVQTLTCGHILWYFYLPIGIGQPPNYHVYQPQHTPTIECQHRAKKEYPTRGKGVYHALSLYYAKSLGHVAFRAENIETWAQVAPGISQLPFSCRAAVVEFVQKLQNFLMTQHSWGK